MLLGSDCKFRQVQSHKYLKNMYNYSSLVSFLIPRDCLQLTSIINNINVNSYKVTGSKCDTIEIIRT